MKTCPFCGAAAEDGAKFCTACGAPFPADATPVNSAPADAAPPQPDFGSYAPAPAKAASKEEFLKLPENEKLRKSFKTNGILCYVFAGLTLLVNVVMGQNYYILLDVAILVALGLGIQVKHSKVCAFLLLAYGLFNVIMGLISSGSPTGYLILLVGGHAVYSALSLDKAWKQYQGQG